jgi:predicted metal-dependent hydrolase
MLSMTTEEYHPYYLQGIEHFNVCDFYEAHEVWEALWTDYQGPSRKFYQGLIQVAVGLHHFGNGNIRGAKKLYDSSRSYLEPYRPAHLGLKLDKLIAEMERCFVEVNASQEQFPEIAIDPELIPEIHLDPPPAENWKDGYVPFDRHHDE